MKVLQICSKPPFPEVDGGCKAMHANTQGLLDNGIDLKVLTISTPKHPFLKEKIPTAYFEKTKVEHVFIDTRVTPLKAFFNLFSSKSYNLERFYSQEFEELIAQTLKADTYDIVLLETFFVTNYTSVIREYTDAKIVYRAHNIEAEIWKRNAVQEKGLKKWYTNFLAKRLKTAEIENIKKVDGIAAITKKDAKEFERIGCGVSITTIPFGINLSDYIFNKPVAGKKVFHIGSMNWRPNQTGIKWLLNNVWKEVVKEIPSAKLNIAGRYMPEWLKSDKNNNIDVLGEVESAIDFINANNMMVVPLLAGSGMRVKIIEGMALGKLVVATSIAAEGINYTNKKNIVIADTPREMCEMIIYYLKNEQEQLEIGKAARQLIESDYDNKIIVGKLLAFFKSI